jgi:XTP/dITP diphosphohydrolase
VTTLVLATHNRAKLVELRRILAGLDVTLLGADDVELPDVEETGQTFAENALLKARSACTASGLPAVADDSGLVVDALGGEPGVHSARYAGRHGDDGANLALVLERMRGRADRRARFVCVAALATPGGREWTSVGVLEGDLVDAPRGTGGFGYDPIFRPLDQARTTAELAPEEKDAISHRGLALRGLRAVIEDL